MIWGDRSGDIGYNAATIAPRRMNFSGLVPVPGDGRYEWNGFLPIKELPHVLNPDKGFYNTSNDYQVPQGYQHWEAIHYVWTDPYRGRTVAESLGGQKKFSVPGEAVRVAELELDEVRAFSVKPFAFPKNAPYPRTQ